MNSSKAVHTIHYAGSNRLHIVILYLLLATLTVLWGLSFVYYSRTIQLDRGQLTNLQQRVAELEATQIIISSSSNGYDPLQRQSRHTRLKSKLLGQQQLEESDDVDTLMGSIYFKVPVGERAVRAMDV